jgi:hypothetical protein
MNSVQRSTININDVSEHRLFSDIYYAQQGAYKRLAAIPLPIRIEAHALYHSICYHTHFGDTLDYELIAEEIGLDVEVITPLMDALIEAGLLSRVFGEPEEPDDDAERETGYRKKPIPNGLRKQVFERDGYRCVQCGDWHDLHADHIHPESKGGLATLDNLQTLCKPCNSRKGARV